MIGKKVDLKFLNPVVEVAGPTPYGYKILDILDVTLPDNIVVTNIENPVILHTPDGIGKKHHVD